MENAEQQSGSKKMTSEDHENDNFIQFFRLVQLRAHNTAKEKGFHNLLSRLSNSDNLDPDDFKEVEDLFVIKALGLICEEVGEAMSARRHHNAFDDKLTHRRGVEVEMADAVIRIMDLAGYLNLDVGGAIIEKMAFNNGRPYMHGKVA